jgi:hypothetical protein
MDGDAMRILFWAGLLLVIFGIASFFVPLPRNETRGVEAGDVKIAVKVHRSGRVPPAVGAVLILGGVGTMFAVTRRKTG